MNEACTIPTEDKYIQYFVGKPEEKRLLSRPKLE
jgi:hypothetical protein